jgi:hypothetical protein
MMAMSLTVVGWQCKQKAGSASGWRSGLKHNKEMGVHAMSCTKASLARRFGESKRRLTGVGDHSTRHDAQPITPSVSSSRVEG